MALTRNRQRRSAFAPIPAPGNADRSRQPLRPCDANTRLRRDVRSNITFRAAQTVRVKTAAEGVPGADAMPVVEESPSERRGPQRRRSAFT